MMNAFILHGIGLAIEHAYPSMYYIYLIRVKWTGLVGVQERGRRYGRSANGRNKC